MKRARSVRRAAGFTLIEILVTLVVSAVGKAKSVADLFCGVGPFALRLAETARVHAADSDKPATAALAKAVRFTQGLKPVTTLARDLFRDPLAPVELQPFDAALVVEKHRHSALVGSGLPVWLHSQGIRRLIVAGIRTEQCCETTTRHASDEGWEVDYVTEATLTFDMTTPAGHTLNAAQIRERTETVLAGRFATICTVEQALQRAVNAA